MNSLRPDGYLETDDTVVASCFLRKWVIRGNTEGELVAVWSTVVNLFNPESSMTVLVKGYPILIHASTVAEVMDFPNELRDGAMTTAQEVLMVVFRTHGLATWLGKHAKRDDV